MWGHQLSARAAAAAHACFLGRRDTGVQTGGIFPGTEHHKLSGYLWVGNRASPGAPTSHPNPRCFWSKAMCPPHHISSSNGLGQSLLRRAKSFAVLLGDTKSSLAGEASGETHILRVRASSHLEPIQAPWKSPPRLKSHCPTTAATPCDSHCDLDAAPEAPKHPLSRAREQTST